MTTDDRTYYSAEDFGDTYYEDEHYGPDDPNSHHTTTECDNCDRPIPESEIYCADCERELAEANARPEAYVPEFDDIAVGYETTIDDLAFVVVPACSRYEAIIKATYALDDRETKPDLPTGFDGRTFILVHETSESTIRPFTNGWGSLPDAVPVASEDGLRLFNKARNRTDWLDDPVEEIPTSPWFYLLDAEGAPITAASEFVALIDGYNVPDDPEEYTRPEYGSTEAELWIVPAFAYTVRPAITS
ncbi:cytochrome c3 family protein [Haloplanus halophilus]|uniref:cytochrome c3 family protein n=1 Tax=Haloplanus halophilus TaxID=2949993 RepID=UPI00203E86FF|nr:cytochrome c3 family protein [Haloplanus sp. GDY1]